MTTLLVNLFFTLDSCLGTRSVDWPSVLMEGARGFEGNTSLTTKRTTMRKKTKVGLQCYFYSYYNHTLLPVPPLQNYVP